jgi:hypothetical protein
MPAQQREARQENRESFVQNRAVRPDQVPNDAKREGDDEEGAERLSERDN